MNQRLPNLTAGQASSAGRARPARHVGRRAGLFGAVLFLGAIALAGVAAAATPVTVGFRDFPYGGGASRVTSDKPQSKLWYTNDGGTITWWGGLFKYSAVAPLKSEFRIDQLVANSWVETTTVVDTRDQSNADYLYDPVLKELYVVSAEPAGCTPAPCDQIKFFRFKYTSSGSIPGTYALLNSADIGTGGTTTATIAKDSTGQLWVAYPQGLDVKISHSTDLNVGASWAAPYRLPSQEAGKDLDVTKSETASIVAFGGNAIGVMWSNHGIATPQTSFAVHADGSDPVSGWPATPEVAISGAGMSDNHINLKADSTGHLYAVTKTTLDGDPIVTKDLILMLDRPAGPAGQAWTKHTVSSVADLNTRAQLLLDQELGVVYVFMTAPNGGGTVYYKSAPLTGSQKLTFVTGDASVSAPGIPFIKSATETVIDDPTTTKQVVDHNTGILVEASDHTAKQYLHNVMTLPATDATPPAGTVAINAGAADTNSISVSVAVPATDAGSGMSQVRLANISTTAGGVLSGAGATSFVYTTPVVWNLAAGADGVRTVYVQWRDGAGNWSTPANDTITLNTAAPTGTLDIAGSGGLSDTNTTAVSLHLTSSDGAGSGVTQVKIANGADPSAAIPQAYAASIPWTLAAGADGVRTVSIQLIDAASNVSSTITDTINLDTTPPAVGTAAIVEGPIVGSTAVHVNVPNADASVASVRLSNSSDFSGAVTQAYATPQTWTLAAGGDGSRSVFVEWADALGNWTAPVQTASVVLDTVVPSAPAVSALTNASLIAKVEITPAAIDGDVNRVYVEANPGVCPATPSSASIPYVAGTPVSFALSGSAPWSVCAWVQDSVNFSPAASASVIVDVTRPRPGSAPFQRFLGTTVGTLPVVLSWTAGTDTGSGIASYLVRRQVDTGAWATIGTTSARTFTVGLSGGHYYRFGIAPVDRAGNVGLFVYGVRFRALGYQERSTAIRYSRGWTLATAPAYWGSRAKVTRARLASATFTFTGRAVALVGTRNAGQGWARIYVDGRLVATVNLNAPSATFRQVLFGRAWTASHRHTVKVVNLATAGHPRLTVDAFLVLR